MGRTIGRIEHAGKGVNGEIEKMRQNRVALPKASTFGKERSYLTIDTNYSMPPHRQVA